MFFSGLSCQRSFPHFEPQPTSASLGNPPVMRSLVSGLAVGTAQTLSWCYSCVPPPPMPAAARARAFSFVRTLIVLFIYSINTESTYLMVWI